MRIFKSYLKSTGRNNCTVKSSLKFYSRIKSRFQRNLDLQENIFKYLYKLIRLCKVLQRLAHNFMIAHFSFVSSYRSKGNF